MVIGIIFQLASEMIDVRIDNETVWFRTQGSSFVTIDSIRLDKQGVIKEHPDLKDNENWREEAIKRFKEKIKTMTTEEQRANYIIEDLTKFGYKPLYRQKSGFRVEKL